MENFFKYNEIKTHFDDFLLECDSMWLYNNCLDELHHECFNMDYYIIGTYQAKQWLGDNALDIINIIKEYEQENFGQVSTDLSNAEQIVNMYVYIVGEHVVNEYIEELHKISDGYQLAILSKSAERV